MKKNETVQFLFTPEFMTACNLAEYAGSITGINGISVTFTKTFHEFSRCDARVNVANKNIYLPILSYTDQLDDSSFRILKALLCHECAHLLFPDMSFFQTTNDSQKQWLNRKLSQLIDDLRVELLLGMEYPEFRMDFKFLIDLIWMENYAIPPVEEADMGYGRFGNFSWDLMNSLYWLMQRCYRGASLVPPSACKDLLPFIPFYGIEKVFEKKIVPVLDPFVFSRDPSREAAEKIMDVLIKYYSHYFIENVYFEGRSG